MQPSTIDDGSLWQRPCCMQFTNRGAICVAAQSCTPTLEPFQEMQVRALTGLTKLVLHVLLASGFLALPLQTGLRFEEIVAPRTPPTSE